MRGREWFTLLMAAGEISAERTCLLPVADAAAQLRGAQIGKMLKLNT